ncbi:MAG: PadR family transcriptional regulator [Jatrophihabitantaceae bacterium]
MPDPAAEFEAERRRHGLTVTSFAVLGLLALREWTSYELARQMKRSFSYFWPRAERRIYDEPKRLADAGYVRARREVVGRRPRTCWVITPKGREALRHWLGEPPTEPPTMEFEGMLKVFLAEHGGKKQLLDTLATIRAVADERGHELAGMSAEIALDGGRFPERVHVNALAMKYMVQVNELTARWARESEEVVHAWRSTASPGVAARERARAEFVRFAGQ